MTTIENLVDQVESELNDAANSIFDAADITQWIRDAIGEYSQYFPLTDVDPITTSANDRQYDLDGRFKDAFSVEYPTGEDPPEYLQRRTYTHPDFWQEDGYYDILNNRDNEDPPEILISTKPADSETITVTFQGIHDNTIAADAAITVPAEHHQILRAYARWKAAVFLAAKEEGSPTSSSSLLMAQMGANARRWEREYANALARAIQPRAGQSQIVSWANKAQETGRVY